METAHAHLRLSVPDLWAVRGAATDDRIEGLGNLRELPRGSAAHAGRATAQPDVEQQSHRRDAQRKERSRARCRAPDGGARLERSREAPPRASAQPLARATPVSTPLDARPLMLALDRRGPARGRSSVLAVFGYHRRERSDRADGRFCGRGSAFAVSGYHSVARNLRRIRAAYRAPAILLARHHVRKSGTLH